MAFTFRTTKGSALTYAELDANFSTPSYGTFGTATGTTTGEVRASGSIVAYSTSDIRYKENIKDIENPLDIVCAVGGKTFTWKQDYTDYRGGVDGYYVLREDFGIIAQDILPLFPLAVKTRDDGSLAVDYEKLVAIAFAAIKEQQATIKSQEDRISKLEAIVPRT